MKVLVVAENGYTESALALGFRDRGYACISLSMDKLKAVDDVGAFLKRQQITIVVNTATASLLKIPKLNFTEHLKYLRPLLLACERLKLPIIQMSNSRVFDAEEGRRYREPDLPEPNTEIGKKYQQLESLVRELCSRHIILRISTLLSPEGENALTLLLNRLGEGGDVDLCMHGNNAPVHVSDFSRVVVALVDQLSCEVDGWVVNVWGDYHYVSSDPTTSYHFAETVLAAMSQYASIENVSLKGIDAIDSEWRRPLLNCSKLLNTFGIKQLPWRLNLVSAVKTYFENIEKQSKKGEVNE